MFIKFIDKVALIQNYQISKILNEKSKEIINTQQFQIISAEGKQVKVYDQDQLLFTLNLVKKIKRITLDYIKSIVYVCDKHGDVFNLDLKNLIGTEKKDIKHIQNNLAIPESCQFFHANNKSYIIQGDSYSKIKLYNAELIDEIIQIWVPFEGFLKQVISQEKLYLVFKRFDENENQYYEIYTMEYNDLENENAHFNKIFPINEEQDQLSKTAKRIQILQHQGLIIAIQLEQQVVIYRLSQNQTIHKQDGILTDFVNFKDGVLIVTSRIGGNSVEQVIKENHSIQHNDHQVFYLI